VVLLTGGPFGLLAKKLTRSDASRSTKAWIALGAATLNLAAMSALALALPHTVGAIFLAKYLSPHFSSVIGSGVSYLWAEPGIHVEREVQATRAEVADERYGRKKA
jgi:hypothetical protein